MRLVTHAWGRSQISQYRKIICITLFIVLLGSCLYSGHYALAQESQGNLQVANTAVEQAFSAVQKAEQAGANVTGLINQLNNATTLLAEAENANRIGDSDTAENDAAAVIPIAQQVTANAQIAQQTAISTQQKTFWSTMASTILGVITFVSVLLIVWRLYKKRYIKNISSMKPEVIAK